MMSVLKYNQKVFLAQYADDEAEPSFSEVVVRGKRGDENPHYYIKSLNPKKGISGWMTR